MGKVNSIRHMPKIMITEKTQGVLETLCELSSQWEASSHNFYFGDKYGKQVSGWPGINQFKIDLAIRIEEQIRMYDGWGNITILFDKVVQDTIEHCFKLISKHDEILELKKELYKWLCEYIKEAAGE